jgi:hypothetical protein
MNWQISLEHSLKKKSIPRCRDIVRRNGPHMYALMCMSSPRALLCPTSSDSLTQIDFAGFWHAPGPGKPVELGPPQALYSSIPKLSSNLRLHPWSNCGCSNTPSTTSLFAQLTSIENYALSSNYHSTTCADSLSILRMV